MQLINDLSDQQYKDLEGVNFSSFKNFFVSPNYFKWKLENPEQETEDLLVGNAVHCAVLQPKEFSKKYAVAPKVDRRKTQDKLIWNEFVEANANKCVLSDESMDIVASCTAALSNSSYFKSLFSKGDEIYIESAGNCDFAGSKIKGRIDFYNKTKNIIFDINNCKDHPDFLQMRRYAEGRLHYMQGFFYSEIVMQNFQLKERPVVVFGYVHKKKPNTIGLSQFGPIYMEKAKRELSEALCRYENCKHTNIWPEASTSLLPSIVEPFGIDTSNSSDEDADA